MKNKKIKDERVIQLYNKFQSEAYLIVLFIAAISIFVKSYLLDRAVTQCITELIIIILSTIYIVIRSVLHGQSVVSISKIGKALTVLFVVISSLSVSISNGIKNFSLYRELYTGIFDIKFIAVLAVSFVTSAIFISAIFALLYWLNSKGQQRIEKILSEEDEE